MALTPHCRLSLLAQLPWLLEIDAGGVTRENWVSWLAEMTEKYGIEHQISPITPDEIHPVDQALADQGVHLSQKTLIVVALPSATS